MPGKRTMTLQTQTPGGQKSRAELRREIERLKDLMVFHYITTGDDGLPEGRQGEQRRREFYDACNQIIGERALALAAAKERA